MSLLSPILPASAGRLARAGVLGINRRNAEFILPRNPRRFYARVDDKLRTKQLCAANDIPVPETYAVIERWGDIRQLPALVEDRPQFVLKPARGAAGRGIIVVHSHDSGRFQALGRRTLTLPELKYHVSTILAGLYSLGGRSDCTIIEQRIVCHPDFARVAVGGAPDVRVIIYRGVPVASMIRLPTQASRGRANLHQGAVGAGVRLATGLTLGGVCGSRASDKHPDTGAPVGGFAIPEWPAVLATAVRLADALGLGYVSVDLVVDAERGPVVLEANARPGLGIQIANRCGLLARLRRVDQHTPEELSPSERLTLAKEVESARGPGA